MADEDKDGARMDPPLKAPDAEGGDVAKATPKKPADRPPRRPGDFKKGIVTK